MPLARALRGSGTFSEESTGAIPCAALRVVAAWRPRNTVRILKLATAAPRRSRNLGTRSLCPGRSCGTRRSRADELAFVAVCPPDGAPIRSQETPPERLQRIETRLLCPGRLCGTRRETASTITRHTCRVNFALTHSKQRIGVTAKCHWHTGSIAAKNIHRAGAIGQESQLNLIDTLAIRDASICLETKERPSC